LAVMTIAVGAGSGGSAVGIREPLKDVVKRSGDGE